MKKITILIKSTFFLLNLRLQCPEDKNVTEKYETYDPSLYKIGKIQNRNFPIIIKTSVGSKRIRDILMESFHEKKALFEKTNIYFDRDLKHNENIKNLTNMR